MDASLTLACASDHKTHASRLHNGYVAECILSILYRQAKISSVDCQQYGSRAMLVCSLSHLTILISFVTVRMPSDNPRHVISAM